MPLEIEDDDKAFLRTKAKPSPAEGDRSFCLVDLFSGCGGLTLGVFEACRRAGVRLDVRLAVEIKPAIAAIYMANFSPAISEGATGVERWFDRPPGEPLSVNEAATRKRVGRVDLLVGGPPCQGHSPLNNHTRGQDPKNELYLAMVRAAEVLRPDSIVIENVPALKRDADGVLQRAEEHLTALGYHIASDVVSIALIGVPQLRQRHVLVASKKFAPNIGAALKPARRRGVRSLKWAIGDLSVSDDGLFDTPSRLSKTNVRRARWLLANDAYDLPNRSRPPCHRDKSDHKYKSMYGRLRWDQPPQTVTTGFGSPGQGRYLHPDQVRTLTAHEAARIQFFPDWFDFSSAPNRTVLAEAIGNAVPPKLSFVLSHYVIAATAQSHARRGEVEPIRAAAL